MNADIFLSTHQLEELLDDRLDCAMKYSNSCIGEVEWIANGQCPSCRMKSSANVVCGGCYDRMNTCSPMQHRACGFTGFVEDFQYTFRKI